MVSDQNKRMQMQGVNSPVQLQTKPEGPTYLYPPPQSLYMYNYIIYLYDMYSFSLQSFENVF